MAAGAGKVALTNTATALSGTCPSGGALLDLVGYGGANCFEGAGPTGALTSTSSAQRKRGCIDENVNSTDFAVALPSPRNSAIANRAVCACTLNETDLTAEADYCNLQFPVSILVQTGTLTPTVYTRLFETAVTPPAGSDPSVIAQVGYGPVTVNPENQAGWVWAAAPFNLQVGSDDEYQLGFTAPAAGSYRHTGRYSRDGTNWTYCDLDGAGSNVGIGFDLTQLGILTVTP